MVSATHVDATAVNTIEWLSQEDTTIVVPVYQRQYRWDIGGCEQLLNDIRSAASGHDSHFMGSILSTRGSGDEVDELVLIDGQQRITTLMLLAAALRHSLSAADADLGPALDRVLLRTGAAEATRLRPHRAWADVFGSVVRGTRGAESRSSRFDDNYAFFRSQIRPHEVRTVWEGLCRLEHVAITLGPGANAQQTFESLNSTGEPLRDHELIHNYVLMGLSHGEQREIEDDFWVPIERFTGDAIGTFWRHYLVMTTGREVALPGEHGVYDAFRQLFPRLDLDTLRAQAAHWRDHAEVYSALIDPAHEPHPHVARHLRYLATFGRGSAPLTMQALHDHRRGALDLDDLVALLESLQSLLLRRSVVGMPTDRLVARLCRARLDGPDALAQAIGRIMPSDERVRIALKFGDLPHAAYVLGRLAGAESAQGLDVEHVFPLAPSDDWTGDGERCWRDYSDDEQNSHRALAQTIGNLTLLEADAAERAFDASYPLKRDVIYPGSAIAVTREIALRRSWGTGDIAERTADLSARFMTIWPRPARVPIDDDGLTPILDAKHRRGWPRGWEREYEYTEYRGEHWEIYDIRSLFHRIFQRLWADDRASVEAFSAQRGGPVYPDRAWNGEWDRLDDEHSLYMGWDAKYMLTAVQGVLDEAGIAAEVFVKYSYVGAAM